MRCYLNRRKRAPFLTEVHREDCRARGDNGRFLGSFRTLRQACQFARLHNSNITCCPYCVCPDTSDGG